MFVADNTLTRFLMHFKVYYDLQSKAVLNAMQPMLVA
jgi:hypothetical protein